MRPEGFSAVMAHRVSDMRGLDYFPTPPWAARAGGELVRQIDRGGGGMTAWEPACGGGHMAHGLRDYFGAVSISDIHDHGGPMAAGRFIGDFLDPAFAPEMSADWIITNPPFKAGEAFVRRGWERARRGVAMLLRLQFLEGAARCRLFRELPPHTVAVFAERVPMVAGRWDPDASSATAYAWFIWVKPGTTAWSDVAARGTRMAWIAPGTKARLSRTEDLERFGGRAPGLFGGVLP
jgi:hypothetical protein